MKHKEKTFVKKGISLGLAAIFTLSLTACGEKMPEQAADGSAWNENWTMIGTTIGVEESDNGFTLLENPAVLAGDDLFYATWVTGEPSEYINEEGKETDLYDAEIYALAMGVKGEGTAEKNISDWIAAEKETYNVQSSTEITCNGQDYTLLTYTVDSDDNPNDRGVTAFTIYGNYCITVEITCLNSFAEDETAVLTAFLEHFHYNAAQAASN